MPLYTEIQKQIYELSQKVTKLKSEENAWRSEAYNSYVNAINWLKAVINTAKPTWTPPPFVDYIGNDISPSNILDFYDSLPYVDAGNACGNNRPNCSSGVATYNSHRVDNFQTFIARAKAKISEIKSYESQIKSLQISLENDPEYKLQVSKQEAEIAAEEKKTRNTFIFIGVVIVVLVAGFLLAKKYNLF